MKEKTVCLIVEAAAKHTKTMNDQTKTPEEIYNASLEVWRKAGREYRLAREAYWVRKISDEQFLAARKILIKAQEVFDEAETAFITAKHKEA